MFAKLGYDLLPYVVAIVVAFFGFVGRHVGPYLKEKVGEKRLTNVAKDLEIAEKQLQQKKGIAYDAVRWAADAFKTLGGLDRLSKAIDWALNEGKKIGVNATKEQWEAAIRIAYTELKPQLSYAVSNLLEASSNKESETKADETDETEDSDGESEPSQSQPDPTPEPVQEVVQEVEKPLTEMTSTDLKNVVAQVVKDHLQTSNVPNAGPQAPMTTTAQPVA
jgi:hypothetical protein